MGKVLAQKMFEIYTITAEQENNNTYCVYLSSYGGKQLLRKFDNLYENNRASANKLFKDINEYNLFNYL